MPGAPFLPELDLGPHPTPYRDYTVRMQIGDIVHYMKTPTALAPVAAVVTRVDPGDALWLSLLEHGLAAVVCRGPVPTKGAAQLGEHFWLPIEK